MIFDTLIFDTSDCDSGEAGPHGLASTSQRGARAEITVDTYGCMSDRQAGDRLQQPKLRSPWNFNENVALAHIFSVKERVRFQIRSQHLRRIHVDVRGSPGDAPIQTQPHSPVRPPVQHHNRRH